MSYRRHRARAYLGAHNLGTPRAPGDAPTAVVSNFFLSRKRTEFTRLRSDSLEIPRANVSAFRSNEKRRFYPLKRVFDDHRHFPL